VNPIKPDNAEKLRQCAHYESLLAHEGFKLLKECATKEVETRWRALRTCAPGDLLYAQGVLDGINFVLEYADVAVGEATAIREAERADQANAVRAQIEQERVRRARSQRDGRPWASVDG
jgi:hypothetical protein